MTHPRRRVALAIVASLALLVLGPAFAGEGGRVLGHSQLVSSSPGAGEVVAEPPAEIRLVFSEPLEPAYTSLDLLDAEGRALAVDVGTPDPGDQFALVYPVDELPDGVYSVSWRALSAADGHATNGFFSFAAGDAPASPLPDGTVPGGGHGHVTGDTTTELQARTVGDLGLMLAFGVGILGWFVFRPAVGRLDPRLPAVQGVMLVTASLGPILLAIIASSSTSLDPFAYLTSSRSGVLLLARALLSAGGGLATLALARSGRLPAALFLGVAAALGGIVLTALLGHGSATPAWGPVAAMVVHLVSASVWLAGVVTLAWAVLSRTDRRVIRSAVPRFSALGLVSVVLLSLSGLYSAWFELGGLEGLGSDYGRTLAIKSLLFVGALLLGLANYLDGGRDEIQIGKLPSRLLAEGALAIAVVVFGANLLTGSPPGREQPVPIATTTSGVAGPADLELEIQPARPGPNRFLVVVRPSPAEGASVELRLERLDETGATRVVLRRATPAAGAVPDAVYRADGGLLAADSRWAATVVLLDPSGDEIAREGGRFGLDDIGLTEGAASPPIEPLLSLALVLLALTVVGAGYLLGGGILPRTEPSVSRIALGAGASVAGVLGIILIVSGPRP